MRSLYTDEPIENQLHIYEPFGVRRALGEILFVSSYVSNALLRASGLSTRAAMARIPRSPI